MIYFRSDYSQGAHPKVMDALVKTNFEHTDGYGLDEHCEHAARMVQDLIDNHDCHVHMMVGDCRKPETIRISSKCARWTCLFP